MAEPIGQTRDRMLRTALALFGEHGYEGASVQMIASSMGLSKAAVSYHFPTKEILLNAVVEPAIADLQLFLDQMGNERSRPGRRRQAIAEYVRLMVKHRELLAFLAREGIAGASAPIRREWRMVTDRLEEFFGGDLDDPAERLYIFAATRGLAVASAAFPELADDELREHLHTVAERLLARPRRRPINSTAASISQSAVGMD
ncbi:TetR/AcrR family transcriptional regulator [Pseudonocardia sp.]|uniref:TetR/AcrR family transcriptional regulator n=1 Tax=Pseudonocardia sp. TaxID=60912 RepID=UPI0031FD432D